MPTPGTPAWIDWHKAHSLTAEDGRVVDGIVMLALRNPEFPDITVAHGVYSTMAHAMRWPGWKAQLVWALIQASVPEDDIPF